MKRGRLQAKDVPDRPVLDWLTRLPPWPGKTEPRAWANWFRGDEAAVQHAMPPETPDKVALAKMRGLMRRGLVTGCPCGCRGDFEITPKGRELLAQPEPIDG